MMRFQDEVPGPCPIDMMAQYIRNHSVRLEIVRTYRPFELLVPNPEEGIKCPNLYILLDDEHRISVNAVS